jgi:hypothetical protein
LKFKEQKDEDKNVPMKYEVKQANTSETIELRCEVNGTTAEKVKLTVFEDRSDE